MYWTFVIKNDFYFELKERTEIKWNSSKNIKKGDIILIYSGSPHSNIGFILRAISDPFEDPEIRKSWNTKAIMVQKLIEISEPIKLSELKENPILCNWGAVRSGFRGSHFKMTEEESEEIKRLIIEKNPELKNDIKLNNDIDPKIRDPRDIHFFDLNAGRAHIVRDLCNLIFEYDNLTEEKLFNLLRRKVGKNDKYWKAYYLRSGKNTSPQYSLNSSRTLGLVEKNSLNLTEPGLKLANSVSDNELFTHKYSINVKKFFFELATSIPSIKTAMEILREKRKLRFYSPTCKEINKVTWDWKIREGKVFCESDKHNKCKSCDNDFDLHMQESSLPLETMLKTNGDGYGFVFWMCSRVTPMHLNGSDPVYSGNYIYWDDESEKELGDLVELLDVDKDQKHSTHLGENEGFNLIRKLYKEFYENYFSISDRIHDNNIYEKERREVHRYYNEIKNNPELLKDEDNPVINYLLPIKRFAVAPAGFKNIKAVHKKENLSEFSESLFKLITNLINTENKNEQKELIETFMSVDNEGIQSAVLSSVLYFLNPNYLYINNKTVKTFNLLSNILENNDTINGSLMYYIDNLEKLKLLIKEISEIVPEFSNFEVFDSFCHWMCDPNLGAYAVNKIKLELLKNPNLNLQNTFKILLNYYRQGKNDKLSADEKDLLRDLLATTIPNRLSEITQEKYKIHSTAWDKWHFCPYVALMNEKVTSKTIVGFFVNYMLREDMSGFYLALRLGVPEFNKNKLINLSEEYRNELIFNSEIIEFSENIDLKSKEGQFPPYYEAANIYSKFYSMNNIPSETELINDLEEMLKIYDRLTELVSVTYNSFNDYLNEKNFIYTPEMIENFLLSLKVKPFVILTGNSGTGKTKIAQLFAEYLQHKNEGDFIIIPVGANWTENRHLMGFYNVITGDYQSTPALDLMIKARNDPLKPYFLILDEMNLSHVERYFSDFLSAIESEKEISLYSPENAKNIKNKNIPEKIEIPANLFVIGTVNVDETTYMFSPKVLDRANTIEFKTYPARDYILCQIEPDLPKGIISYLESPLSKTRKSKINELKADMEHIIIQDKNLWEVLASEIHSFQDVLSEAGFDFGFRVIDEVIRFMYAAWLYEDSPAEWNNWQRYFDAQIMQKMLPKLHGSQQELSPVLENLFKLCHNGESVDTSWYRDEMNLNEFTYPSSAQKLQKMARKLHEKRFVSFTD